MIDERSMILIKHLIESPLISKVDLMEKANLTKRQIEYTLDKINDYLKNEEKNGIKFTNGKLDVPEDVFLIFVELINRQDDFLLKQYVLNQEERIKFILWYLYEADSYISVNHLLSLLKVGKTTLMKDMSLLNERLQKDKISIEYNRVNGYYLKGDYRFIRKKVLHDIVETLTIENNRKVLDKFILENQFYRFEEVMNYVKQLSSKYQIEFIEDRLLEFVYMFIIFSRRKFVQEEIIDSLWQKQFSTIYTNEYQFSQSLLECFGIKDISFSNYISAWILGVSIGNFEKYYFQESQIKEMVESIIKKFEQITGVDFKSKKNIQEKIYLHFRCVYFRWLFHIPMLNPLTKSIKIEYDYLFNLVKTVLKDFESNFKMEISEDEIAYLTMHFSSIIENVEESKVKAAIVCHSGLGTSALLYTQLKQLFPDIKFLEPKSSMKIDELISEVDIIFSSTSDIFLEQEKKVFMVKPILSRLEKRRLSSQVYYYLGKSNQIDFPNVQEVLSIVGNYVDMTTLSKIQNDILNRSNLEKKEELKLSDIIVREAILFQVEAQNAKEAIIKSSIPLIQLGYFSENYLNEMLQQLEYDASYYILSDGIAFPHTRIENGVYRTGIGITILKQPVLFKNHFVHYILCFSATDYSSHLGALSTLLKLIETKEWFRILESSSCCNDILSQIKEFEDSKERL